MRAVASDLAEEYRLIYSRIDQFNATIHSSRGWFLAAVGLALNAYPSFATHELLLGIAVLVFSMAGWLNEALIIGNRERLLKRVEKIEDYFSGSRSGLAPYQARREAMPLVDTRWKKFTALHTDARRLECWTFYILFVLGSLFYIHSSLLK